MGGDHALSLIFYALSLCTEIGILCVSSSLDMPVAVIDNYWIFARTITTGARVVVLGSLCLVHARRLHRWELDTSNHEEMTPLLEQAKNKNIKEKKLNLRDYLIVWPLLWSSGSMVHMGMVTCVLLVLIRRALSFAIPLRLGIIIDAFGDDRLPWLEVGKYGLLLLLLPQLDVLQGYLWSRAKAKFEHNLALHSFRHLMKLDIDFHLSTSTAEATWDLRSTSSVSSIYELIAFSVFPTAVSLIGSLFYMYTQFNVYYAFLVVYTTVCYLWVTLSFNEVATRRQRENSNRLIREHNIL